MTTFTTLGLPDALARALAARGIHHPFPVQEATIPDALAGRDISGRAPTGSGKTLAFGLPTLARVDPARAHRPSSLILAPTRELAEQIKRELARPAKAVHRLVYAVYGGVGYGPQKTALRTGVDVLVATPGRLEDLIEQGAVDLGDAVIVVIDEADRMADMGFLPAVRRILDQTPKDRQTLLFSATLDGDIAVLSRDYQTDPVRRDTAPVESAATDARHHFWLVEHNDRVRHAADVVHASGSSIVFTRTRHGADRVAKQLVRLGVDAVALHGGRSQNQRTRALRAFTTGRARALIATDVAARGIHIDAVASVVHFDPPGDPKDYVHRSGRTARAGATGTVVSLVTADQKRAVRRLQRALDLDVPIGAPHIDGVTDTKRSTAPPTPLPDSRSGRDEKRPAPKPAGDRKPSRDRQPIRNEKPATNRPHSSDKKAAGATDTPSVYVANLPWRATGDDLMSLFARYGDVHAATVITDKRGRSKGYGFVDMPSKAARTAIEALHGADLNGRDLTVRFAKPRTYG